MAPVVGYWNIRGLGEPIRTLLHYAGVDFEDKRYRFGDMPGMAELNEDTLSSGLKEWADEKHKLGLDFPNLPYYIDGDINITQSLAIVRYLAKKHGLYPTNERDEIRTNIFEQMSRDFQIELGRAAYYPPPPESLKGLLIKRTLESVKVVSDALGDQQWLVANKISYVDFLMVESLDQLSYLYPQITKEYPNIGSYIKRLEALPGVQKYMQGEKYKIWPIFSTAAQWGGSGEAPKRAF